MHPGHVESIHAMTVKARVQWIADITKAHRGVTLSHGITTPQVINIVIVNGRQFLLKKKGFEFMPLEHRMAMVDYCLLGSNGLVVAWEQVGDDSTVNGALDIIQPHFFAKGGDRTKDQGLAEQATCDRHNIQILWNCGGGKIQSSSDMMKNAIKEMNHPAHGNKYQII